jgi:hypothetical protein
VENSNKLSRIKGFRYDELRVTRNSGRAILLHQTMARVGIEGTKRKRTKGIDSLPVASDCSDFQSSVSQDSRMF